MHTGPVYAVTTVAATATIDLYECTLHYTCYTLIRSATRIVLPTHINHVLVRFCVIVAAAMDTDETIDDDARMMRCGRRSCAHACWGRTCCTLCPSDPLRVDRPPPAISSTVGACVRACVSGLNDLIACVVRSNPCARALIPLPGSYYHSSVASPAPVCVILPPLGRDACVATGSVRPGSAAPSCRHGRHVTGFISLQLNDSVMRDAAVTDSHSATVQFRRCRSRSRGSDRSSVVAASQHKFQCLSAGKGSVGLLFGRWIIHVRVST